MDVTAKLRYLRMSPRKVRLIVDLIRGEDVSAAIAQLTHLSKWAARPVLKLLNSAVANAEHNFKLKPENLFVKHVVADEGPTLKRFQPKAFGRADVIRKRTTHISLVLGERQPTVTKKTGKRFLKTPPTVPAAEISHAPKEVKPSSEPKKPAKRVLTRAKELGSKIIHRRGND